MLTGVTPWSLINAKTWSAKNWLFFQPCSSSEKPSKGKKNSQRPSPPITYSFQHCSNVIPSSERLDLGVVCRDRVLLDACPEFRLAVADHELPKLLRARAEPHGLPVSQQHPLAAAAREEVGGVEIAMGTKVKGRAPSSARKGPASRSPAPCRLPVLYYLVTTRPFRRLNGLVVTR